MAVVTFNKKDLESLTGKKLSEADYREKIPMMGTPLERFAEGEVDFEVFPDRPDLLSVEGFARAVQGFLGVKTGLAQFQVKKGNFTVNVDKSLLGLRGCAAFAVVKGLKFTDESVAAFMQLQEKLATTIGRKRKKASIGAYDLTDLRFPLSLTAVPKDTKFVPLGFSEEHTLAEVLEKHPKGIEYADLLKNWIKYPVYIDAKKRIMSLLPITNSEFAKIKPDTKNMLIEVTGIEWKSVMEMLNIVVTALADRGVRIYEVKTVYPTTKRIRAPFLQARRLKFDINYANKLLDLDLKPNELKGILEKMRFGMIGKDVLVPAYRTDVMHPIDLVEDIAIGHGYEKFEPRIPKIATIASPLEKEDFANAVRNAIIGSGFQEVVNFVLTNAGQEFEKMQRPGEEHVEIKNPKTVDYTMARLNLIPSLMNVFAQNQSAEFPQKIFELGLAVKPDMNSETGAVNVEKIAAGIMHSNAGYNEMKSVLETFLRNLGKQFELEDTTDSSFIDGRVAEILIDEKSAGLIGEIHPEVLVNFGIEYPVVVFELDVGKLK